jgi:hypothetical protein
MIIKKNDGLLISKIAKYLDEHPEKVSTSTKLSPTYIIKCERQAVYKLKGVPQETSRDFKSRLIVLEGDSVHKKYVDLFREMGILVDSEKFISHPNFPFLGFVDAIVKIDDVPYIVEIKSINKEGFGRLNKPYEEHVLQVKMYMLILKIDKSIIFYENKDTQDLKEFYVELNSEFESWFNEKMNRILNYFKENKVPPRICVTEMDGRYQWCPYVKYCFQDNNK